MSGESLHGRQVGVGTILAAELWRRVLEAESPALAEPAAEIDAAFWGGLAGAVTAQYAEKLPRIEAARKWLAEPGRWDQLREQLSPLPRRPEQIAECLSRAGAACGAGDIGCSKDRLLSVLLHAHQMRSRFTILDLARLAGVMDSAAATSFSRLMRR